MTAEVKTQSTDVDHFVDELYDKWCLGQKRYVNAIAVKADIKDLLTTFIKERLPSDKSEDETYELVREIVNILVILDDRYQGEKWFDGRDYCDIDHKVAKSLQGFLESINSSSEKS